MRDLQLLGAAEARALELALKCDAALLLLFSGIIDSHGLMSELAGASGSGRRRSGLAVTVKSIGAQPDMSSVGGAEPMVLLVRPRGEFAGLRVLALASAMQGLDARHVPPGGLQQGLRLHAHGQAPFNRLVYPLPQEASLGVHLTLDLAGQARFGPDAQWLM